jgi:hypothetical protein
MRATRRTCWAAFTLVGLTLLGAATPAGAQMSGMGRSLGGYGESTIGSYYRSRGGPLLPYGGGLGGFVPYEGIEPRPAAVVMMPRPIPTTPIGGVGRMGIPIGGASRMQGPDIYRPFNYRGRFGMGGAAPMPQRYGPGLGSPYRQPASLIGGSRGGMGSM